jgi:hypothetical protein
MTPEERNAIVQALPDEGRHEYMLYLFDLWLERVGIGLFIIGAVIIAANVIHWLVSG